MRTGMVRIVGALMCTTVLAACGHARVSVNAHARSNRARSNSSGSNGTATNDAAATDTTTNDTESKHTTLTAADDGVKTGDNATPAETKPSTTPKPPAASNPQPKPQAELAISCRLSAAIAEHGTAYVIEGSGFEKGALVTFVGKKLPTKRIEATKLTVTIPGHAKGKKVKLRSRWALEPPSAARSKL